MFKRLLFWAFMKYYLNDPGIHIITAINVNARSPEGKKRGQKAVEKFNAIQHAAEDQLKAELADIVGGNFKHVNNLHDKDEDNGW
jgi:hypothetical protein